jgi:acyl-CoA hydrolase
VPDANLPEPPPPLSPRASRVETVQLVLPGLTNVYGTVFGGILMQWIDIAAAIAATRHSGEPVVTASMDRLHFLRPVKLGGVVVIQSQVNFVARTSMEVGVRVFVEDPRSKVRVQTTRAYLTMVAVDDRGQPVPVAPLAPETDEDRRRMGEGQRRREVRLAERRAIEEGHG